DDISRVLTEVADPDEACRQLIDLALAGGGADNVTVVIGDVLEGEVETTAGVSVGSVHLNHRYAASGPINETSAPTDTEACYDDGESPTDTVPLQAVPGDEDGKTGHEDTKPMRTGSGEGEEDDDLGEEVGKRSFLGWIITGLVIIAL